MTMLQLARTTRTLETLGAALERSGFAAQSTPSSLTFHAPGQAVAHIAPSDTCLLYTSPSPRD